MISHPISGPFRIDLRDADAFLETLRGQVERTGPDDDRLVYFDIRHELRGHVRAEEIFIELVTIPTRSRLFQFSPYFKGRLSDDRRRLVGSFRLPFVMILLPLIFLVWLFGVFTPTIAAVSQAGFPRGRIIEEVIPVMGGLVIGTGLTIFARWQARAHRRNIEELLRAAAG